MPYLVLSIILVVAGTILGYKTGEKMGAAESRITAMKEALKTNPPSDELELVCAGLWVGEQNKKYYEKERRNAR